MKKKIVKLSIAALFIVVFGFNLVVNNSKKTLSPDFELENLISNTFANAEGGITCGSSGSGCQYTINGVAYTSDVAKEAGQ